jgi:predicted acyl esterase
VTVLRRSIATVMVLAAAVLASAQTQTVMLPAPDGTRLATDLYLPAGSGPWPVLLSRTPYDKTGERDLGLLASIFGIAYVTQDTRGRYASEGTDTVFRDDGADGRATLDWILAQTWCDGRVATWGPSALGITQYMLAPGADPRLVCQMPIVATPDLYAHAAFPGGAFREALLVNWLAGQGSLDALDEFLAHRLRDAWWEPLDASRAGQVRSAGLHMGGWYDIFLGGTLDAFRAIQQSGGDGARGRQYVVIGPWTHNDYGGNTVGELTYPANAVLDLDDLLFDWLDHCFGDGPSPVDAWPAARVYLMGAVGEPGAPGNRWVELESWPPAVRTLPLYLAAGGLLSPHSAPSASLGTLVMDPGDPVPTLGGANLFPDLVVDGRPMGDGPHDQGAIESRADVMVFTTDPLESPVTVMGPVRVRLWIEPDTPDLDLAVRLTDVYPDGRSMLVIDGAARARARCGDDRECLLTEGEPTEIEVLLSSTAMVFNAGHRIRIVVSGSNWPRFEVNPNHGAPFEADLAPRVARPVLLAGADHPSRLELPVPASPRRADGRRTPGR